MLTQKNALNIWLKNTLTNDDFNLYKLAGDASFRQYYRLSFANTSQIVMDSSHDKLCFQKFIELTNIFANSGLPVPRVYAANNPEAYALIEDFGDDILLNFTDKKLDEIPNSAQLENTLDKRTNQELLYKQAINILCTMQNINLQNLGLARFDTQQISLELNIFNEWFIDKYLQINLSGPEKQIIQATFNKLIAKIESMPQCLTHMDYHSRNIMVLKNGKLGIIDYQDARIAPYTYDLVSILKDCYVKHSPDFINSMLNYFFMNANLCKTLTFAEFIKCYDLCGLQRHLKVLGIFSRLHIRDHKHQYLQDIPLVIYYILTCLESYPEYIDLYEIMNKIQNNPKLSEVCEVL